jgi:hypothetical protein
VPQVRVAEKPYLGFGSGSRVLGMETDFKEDVCVCGGGGRGGREEGAVGSVSYLVFRV